MKKQAAINGNKSVKHSEEELIAASQFSKKVFKNLPVGLAVYQFNGQCVLANPRFCEILGGQKEDVIQQNFKQLASWKDSGLLENAEFVLVNGGEKQCEVELISTFGKDIWIEAYMNRFILEAEPHLLLMVTDITKRKLAQQEVVDSEENFRTLYENIAGGILIVDDDYVIRDVNERTCEITGYKKDELVGQLCDIVCPKGSASKECPIWEKKQSGFIGMDTAIKRKDAFKNPIIKNAKRLKVHGKPMIFENFQDIAKRKMAESELIKAKEEAEAANKLKTQFISNISHELRTPLNAIISLNELMLDTSLHKEQLELNHLIEENADKLRSIIDAILDFSRMELKHKGFVGKEYCLSDVLEYVSEKMKVKASAKKLTYTVNVDPKVPDVLQGEAEYLQQVLIYLIDNAIKFTSAGGVEVDIALDDGTGDESKILRFTISDSGIGIPGDQFEEIFDLFYQVDGSYTRSYGGTGLGLAIVKEFVKAMGGEIGLESTVGKGSTFWFTVSCS